QSRHQRLRRGAETALGDNVAGKRIGARNSGRICRGDIRVGRRRVEDLVLQNWIACAGIHSSGRLRSCRTQKSREVSSLFTLSGCSARRGRYGGFGDSAEIEFVILPGEEEEGPVASVVDVSPEGVGQPNGTSEGAAVIEFAVLLTE